MILIVVEDYVNENSKYSNAFVHSRVKAYLKSGINVSVYCLKKTKNSYNYTYENVNVIVGDGNILLNFINKYKVKKVCMHFFSFQMSKVMSKIGNDVKLFIFVHGHEALRWYQRLFRDKFNTPIQCLKFFKYMIINTYNIKKIRHFMKLSEKKITIIGVSQWMLDVAIKNWRIRNDNIDLMVVPNVVNEDIFNYIKKDVSQRYNILILKQFHNGKYACDLIEKTIIKLSKMNNFHEFNILIIGKGRLFHKYTKKLIKFSNVKLRNNYFSHDEIANVHKEFGILLCPTRQDAQGVTMCEAMASGLIPITINCTAIPEFVPNDKNILCVTTDDMVKKIMEISNDPKMFSDLSENMSKFILKKCCKKETSDLEIDIINR